MISQATANKEIETIFINQVPLGYLGIQKI